MILSLFSIFRNRFAPAVVQNGRENLSETIYVIRVTYAGTKMLFFALNISCRIECVVADIVSTCEGKRDLSIDLVIKKIFFSILYSLSTKQLFFTPSVRRRYVSRKRFGRLFHRSHHEFIYKYSLFHQKFVVEWFLFSVTVWKFSHVRFWKGLDIWLIPDELYWMWTLVSSRRADSSAASTMPLRACGAIPSLRRMMTIQTSGGRVCGVGMMTI